MKWPASLTFIRHGESAYNASKVLKEKVPGYPEFRRRFDHEYALANTPWWASSELQTMARELAPKINLPFSDFNTPLTPEGEWQAETTGRVLQDRDTLLPDMIYVSPYLRTRRTLEGIKQGWPKLDCVTVREDERVREQEHGLSGLYNDWRIFFALNPEQGFFKKREGDYGYRWPQGESELDVRQRIHDMLATLIREHSGEHIWIISHHLTLLCLRAQLERWDRERFVTADRDEKPINCGVTVFQGRPRQGKQGKLVLAQYNQKFY